MATNDETRRALRLVAVKAVMMRLRWMREELGEARDVTEAQVAAMRDEELKAFARGVGLSVTLLSE